MNPILPLKHFIPDVEAHQWKDKVYLYGSKDFPDNDAYCSREYDVFSSDDMKSWTVHPNSFHSSKTNYPTSPLYAPDAAFIDGQYCLFFCQAGGTEGVAFSQSPSGPFENARPIGGAECDGIDPTVFVDDDGQVYFYWGQFNLRGAKLDTKSWSIIPETKNTSLLDQKAHGFHEGSSIVKRNDTYYMVYADESRGKPTCLGYATSKNPLGPYEKKGIIIDNDFCDPDNWNNHGSLAQINDRWYIFYHRASHNSHFSRRVCVEEVFFDEFGLIKEVEMTSQGVDGPIDCTRILNMGYACKLLGSAYLSHYQNGENSFDYLHNIHAGDVAVFKYLDFDKNPNTITITASNVSYPTTVHVFLDDTNSAEIASICIERTDGNFDFQDFSCPISQKISGVHSLHLVFEGMYNDKLACIKSVNFSI